MNLKAAALDLVARGFWIFPVVPRSKVPLTAHGLKDATSDPTVVERWWTECPHANIGIATGPSGLVVLDVDTNGKGGTASLAKLQQIRGALPPTLTIKTGGGGLHYYFRGSGIRSNSNSWGPDFPGLDIRSEGGYVVAAPSVHASGERYQVIAPTEMHLWPEDLTPPQRSAEVVPDDQTTTVPRPTDVGRAIADAREALAKIPGAIQGKNGSGMTFGAAIAVSRYGLTKEETLKLLVEEYNPRCEPPWDVEDLKRKIRDARKTASAHTTLDDQETKEAITEVLGIVFDDAPSPPPVGRVDTGAPRAGKAEPKLYTSAEILALGSEEIPFLTQYLIRGCITEVAAKVKSGKSAFILAMIRALLTGTPFLGRKTVKCKVLYMNEMPVPSFIEAMRVAKLLGLEGLYVFNFFDKATIKLSWPERMAFCRAKAKELGCDVFVIDTISKWVGLTGDRENNAGDWEEAFIPIGEACADGLTCIFARHGKKGESEVGESGRGSSAASGNSDVILKISRVSETGNQRRIDYLGRYSQMPASAVVIKEPSGNYKMDVTTMEGVSEFDGMLLAELSHDPKTPKDIKTGAGLEQKEDTIMKHLRAMERRGQIKMSGVGNKSSPFKFFLAGATIKPKGEG